MEIAAVLAAEMRHAFAFDAEAASVCAPAGMVILARSPSMVGISFRAERGFAHCAGARQ